MLVYCETGREVGVNRVADMGSLEASWSADTAEGLMGDRKYLGMGQCGIDEKGQRDVELNQADPKEV